ncbi:MAG: hypothetical protein JWP61_2512, partial [Friedmanniella sp.]|nr:hypothetical protein [Friedmanniella sp.]
PSALLLADGGGWRQLWVDAAGAETTGPRAGAAEAAWARRWWPVGVRVEVGLTREAAWADLVRRLGRTGGTALMLDYGHDRTDRPPRGSLAGFRSGRAVPPRPGADLNLTAHVAVDAVRAAGEAAGAVTRSCRPLHEVVRDRGRGPGADGGLQDLVRRSEYAALAAPQVWGRQWWLHQDVAPETTKPGPTPEGRTGLTGGN